MSRTAKEGQVMLGDEKRRALLYGFKYGVIKRALA
jgi:hypothetical protein